MTPAEFALLVVIFFAAMFGLLAWEMHHTPPVDQLTETEVEQDWVDERFAEIVEGEDAR